MTALPEGFSTITPTMTVADSKAAIALYARAFGAKEIYKLEMPGTGKVMHACFEIGNSRVFISDEMPGCAPSAPVSFYLYMPDADAAMAQALKAGLSEKWPVSDMFWGDRMGTVADQFGNMWTLATKVKDVSQTELEQGAKDWVAKMQNQKAA